MSTATQQRLSLEAELSTLTAELIEAFTEADEQAGDMFTERLLKSYIRHVTRCGLSAGRCGLSSVQDYCVRFQEMLKTLLVKPAYTMAAFHTALEQWPLLVMSYLHNEDVASSDAQLNELMDSLELLLLQETPITPEVEEGIITLPAPAEMLALLPVASPVAAVPNMATAIPAEVTVQPSLPPETEALELLRLEVMAAIDPLLQEGDITSDSISATVLTDCADQLALAGVSMASAGLVGLMDVVQLLQDALRQRSDTAAALSRDELDYLLTCRDGIATYLQDPNNNDSIANLIANVASMPWLEPLTMSNLQTLRELLATGIEPLPTNPAMTTDLDVLPSDTMLPATPGGDETAVAHPIAYPDIPKAYFELSQMVAQEFESNLPLLVRASFVLNDTAATATMRQDAVDQLLVHLERFAAVTGSLSLAGLHDFLQLLIRFYTHAANSETQPTAMQLWLAEWPAYVLAYLANPFAEAEALVVHCRAGQQLLALTDSQLSDLVQSLAQPQINIDDVASEPRQTKAEATDVSLALPEDVNRQLLDSLLQELPQQTAAFSAAISRIIRGNGSVQDVELAQRVAHTLKGSANTVGVAGIANLTHHIEDILQAFSKAKRLPATPLTATLQDAADVLEMMSETLLGSGQLPQSQAVQVLQQVLDWANQIDLNGLPEASEVLLPNSTAPQHEQLAAPVQEVAQQSALRVPITTIDEIMRLVGESMILNSQLQEGLRHILLQNKSLYEQNTRFAQLAFELEQLVDIRGLSRQVSAPGDSNFDALEMDQYSELHTLTRRLVETVTDTRQLTQGVEDGLRAFEGMVHAQGRIQKDTQDVVMQTRMLPAQTILPRLQRSVRQACRATNKQAELVIQGEDTLIDSDILNAIADPLMHILRNAVDHGIQTAEIREQAGKVESGRIELSFGREGEHILIRCRDDGAGLDYAAILRVALAKGIIDANTTPTQEQLARLIFLAGFSTREQTTQVSGRGIGMDAAATQVQLLKGNMRIESTPGLGTLIEIRLPVTLVTLHGIMVKARDQVIAISNRGVEQILHADAGTLASTEGKLTYRLGEASYPAYYLEDLLGMVRSEMQAETVKRPALLIQGEADTTFVVLAEAVITTQDLVMKQLGQYVPMIAGLEGATILGDGRVAAVINLSNILQARREQAYQPLIERGDITNIQSGAPLVMVVDDSLSARRSLAEYMQDVGYRVITARDGIEAIEMLAEHSPDLLLVDMEMPRMNGLELTSYVRANKAIQNLPIIMITSRSTDKHRQEADKAGVNAYLVKPYSEADVITNVEAQLTRAYAIN